MRPAPGTASHRFRVRPASKRVRPDCRRGIETVPAPSHNQRTRSRPGARRQRWCRGGARHGSPTSIWAASTVRRYTGRVVAATERGDRRRGSFRPWIRCMRASPGSSAGWNRGLGTPPLRPRCGRLHVRQSPGDATPRAGRRAPACGGPPRQGLVRLQVQRGGAAADRRGVAQATHGDRLRAGRYRAHHRGVRCPGRHDPGVDRPRRRGGTFLSPPWFFYS